MRRLASTLSTVAAGRAYEEAVIAALGRRLGFTLRRRGGAGDQGLDFVGRLGGAAAVGGQHEPIPVLGQCKWEAKPVGPAYVRELVGAAARAAAAGHAVGSAARPLAVLASASGFSPAALRLGLSYKEALLFLHLEPEASGAVVEGGSAGLQIGLRWRSVVCNPAAEALLPADAAAQLRAQPSAR